MDPSRRTTLLGFVVIGASIFFIVLAGQELRTTLLGDEAASGLYLILVAVFGIFIVAMVGVMFPDFIGGVVARAFHPEEGPRQARHYGAARALRAQRKFREAAEAFLASATEAPDDPTPLVEAAAIYAENLMEGGTAVEIYRRALEVAKEEGVFSFVCHRTADILLEQDRREEARTVLLRLVDRYPDAEPAERARERLARLR